MVSLREIEEELQSCRALINNQRYRKTPEIVLGKLDRRLHALIAEITPGNIEIERSRRAICTTCREVYTTRRAPTEGRGNYCPACRANGRKWRHLKAHWRAKRRVASG